MHQIMRRECHSMDFGWRFALGHSYDVEKDFKHGTGYFSHITKTGYGDGPAAPNFDDRAWRILDVPHDWCVELPFDARGGHSHGYKAIGRNFPENSVGWYRKAFFIPEGDLGRRISIEFEGVHRDSIVWVNGFYLGTEHSGYSGFGYDVSDYLNYGGENVVAVRANTTLEEGWYYEGAGIYRHVWLAKTGPLHVARYGTFIVTELEGDAALITIRTTIINESPAQASFDLEESILDANDKELLTGQTCQLSLQPGAQRECCTTYHLASPQLWSLETPYLHQLQTVVRSKGEVVDACTTSFGIRTVRFDANEGFFLNGKNTKLLGTNLHQDHAGVGVAIPDALYEYRIRRMQAMGSNAIRTSHNPPAPAFLEACDRLGMLVLDENRLMGCNPEHFDCLERLMKRDRNHPSVILWSLGNEEWAIEGNIKGARITETMQNFAKQFDPSRAFTVAFSGGWDTGAGMVAQVMGYNYIVQGDIDAHHAKFPWQPAVGTEETTTHQTRGIHLTGGALGHIPPENRLPENVGTETGWQFYAARPFLGGLFYWTGFDYRGESNPFLWPAVINQSGPVDLCGFPKDGFYYLKAWWGKEPLLHICPHWNWAGREGQQIPVTVYGNCEKVELSLNGQGLGMKEMPRNGHLEWSVAFQPGVLTARGFTNGQEVLSTQVGTSGTAALIQLTADKILLRADGQDLAVIAVQVNDDLGHMVPSAEHEISFRLDGPGKIIGVGNGDPLSHEAERYFENVRVLQIGRLKELAVDELENRPEVAADVDDTAWPAAFQAQSDDWQVYLDPLIVVRGEFELSEFSSSAKFMLFTKSIVENQSVYLNGQLLGAKLERGDHRAFALEPAWLKPGRNVYAVTGQRFRKKSQWEEPNIDPGVVQLIEPVQAWRRKLFNGLAQVIVQSSGQSGELRLTAAAPGLEPTTLNLHAQNS